MIDRPSLRSRLAGGEQLLGAILRMPAEPLVEMAAIAGLDCVLLDLEHGPADLVALQHHVTCAQAHGVATLVRVGADEPALVLRCLDQGVAGVVVAHVSDAAAARAAVAAAHYPPLGTRGFASYTRAGRHGATSPSDLLDAAAETLVVVMVEDAAGCANADDILATDGVDAVLVGPADLAVALGHRGDARHPEVLAARDAVHRAAGVAGRTVVTIAGDRGQAEQSLADGAGLVLYNTAHVLTHTFRSLASARRH